MRSAFRALAVPLLVWTLSLALLLAVLARLVPLERARLEPLELRVRPPPLELLLALPRLELLLAVPPLELLLAVPPLEREVLLDSSDELPELPELPERPAVLVFREFFVPAPPELPELAVLPLPRRAALPLPGLAALPLVARELDAPDDPLEEDFPSDDAPFDERR